LSGAAWHPRERDQSATRAAESTIWSEGVRWNLR
jgi:hypothetical protein